MSNASTLEDRLRSHYIAEADELRLPPLDLSDLVRSGRHVTLTSAQPTSLRRTALVAAAVVALVALAGGLVLMRPRPVAPADSVATSQPATTVVATPLVSPLSIGSSGDQVLTLQQRLHEFGFNPGPADGEFGELTQQAVWAFEALVLGRTWNQQSGLVDNAVWQLMQSDLDFSPRRPGAGTHVEIYLDLQTMVVFADNAPALITHISSGTGETWCALLTLDTDESGQPLPEVEQRDVCGDSTTPGGSFRFYGRYDGNRMTPLGEMFNPVYFNHGLAVYGSQNVPDFPASHGGIRIPMAVAADFPVLVADDDVVYVWDGVKEPEQQVLQDTIPILSYPNPNGATTTTG